MGNGFPLKGEKPLLMGGGIGVPPMVQLGKTLKANGCTQVQTIAGYRDELFLTEELGASGAFYVATEDGSAGTKGNVSRCDLCLRAKAYASCHQSLCRGKGNRVLSFHGRAYGLWNRCLSCLCLSVQREG